jgi:hypothetical protein
MKHLLLVSLSFVTGMAMNADAQTFENQTVPGITTFAGAELVLRNCMITGPVVANAAKSVTVENCYLDPNGKPAVQIVGGCPAVYIGKNIFANALVAVQLNGVWNDPAVTIEWNQDASGPWNYWNDQISIYMSSGTPARSIIIRNNYVQVDPNSPHAPLSGGIVAGDTGSMYVIDADNVTVNCTNGLWYNNGNTSRLIGNIVSGSTKQNGVSGLSVRSGYAIGNVVDWTGPKDSPAFDFHGVGEQANNATGPLTDLYWQWANETLAHDIHVGPQ